MRAICHAVLAQKDLQDFRARELVLCSAWQGREGHIRARPLVARQSGGRGGRVFFPTGRGALGHGDNVRGFAAALQRGGYATDPSYAAKLAHIADSAPMREALGALKNPSALPTL